MHLKEFKAQSAVGSVVAPDRIVDIAESLLTNDDVLLYLVDHGTNLPGFGGWNFSSVVRYTLGQKHL